VLACVARSARTRLLNDISRRDYLDYSASLCETHDMSGKDIASAFKRASRAAVRRALDNGHDVTVKTGKRVVRRSASGAEDTVLELDHAYARPKKKRYDLTP